MKQIKNYASAFLFFFLLVACSKDAEVVSSFPFVLTETHPETTTINLPQETSFKVTPERVVSSNVYEYKYEVLSGEGTFLDVEGNPITEDTFLELPDLNHELFYVSPKIGEDKVRVTVQDSGEQIESIDVVYAIEHNDYEVELSTPLNTTKVNKRTPITFSLFNTGADKSVVYERAFFIIQGSGKLYDSGSEEEIPMETYVNTTEGTYNYDINFSDFGDARLVVATRDSNQQVKNDTLEFEVNEIDIDFTATTQKNSAFIGQDVEVIFGLAENQGEGGSYQLRYVVDEGEATMSDNGNPLSPGVLYDVELGNFSWTATVMNPNPGPLELSFFLKNQNGIEIEKIVELDIASPGLNLSIDASDSQAPVGASIDLTGSIEQDPEDEALFLVFSSTQSGTITYENDTYYPGDQIPLNTEQFAFQYTGTTPGTHTITFSAENGLSAFDQAIEQLEFENPDFSINSIPAQNSITVGEALSILHTISTVADNHTFQMRYVANAGQVTVRNQFNQPLVQGQLYAIPKGDFNWTVTPNVNEDVEVTFTVVDNFGLIKASNVEFNVIDPSFDFTLTHAQNVQSKDGMDISFDLTGSNELEYDISYNIIPNDGSTLRWNGNILQQNSQIDVGTMLLDFEFEGVKNYEIEFTVKTNFATEVVKSANFSVIHTPFSFTVANANSIANFSPLALTLSLSGSNSLQYTVSRSILSGNGSFNFGNNTSLSQGNNARSYTPSSLGQQELRFIATDNFGNSKTVNRSFSVVNPVPVINQVGFKTYEKGSCWDLDDVTLQCQLYFRFNLDYTSQYPLTKYRTKIDNVVSSEKDFFNNTPGSCRVYLGAITIFDNNSKDDSSIDLKPGEAFEVQIKDSNGEWSNWYQLQTNNSYGF